MKSKKAIYITPSVETEDYLIGTNKTRLYTDNYEEKTPPSCTGSGRIERKFHMKDLENLYDL